jgi:5,10-methylenetetrahydromethanopterin reductase
MIPKFGLNRHDQTSVSAYAKDVARAEQLGWDCAFLPDSPLRIRDNYVLLAAAAQNTNTITIGPLLTNPIIRKPFVTASSISTVAELAPNRTILGMGVGDTAVRLAGLKPARVKELEDAVKTIRILLSGDEIELGGLTPSKLAFAQSVPVWVASAGPRTLKMAGASADGVFIRVGTDIHNVSIAVEKIREGAEEAGKDPKSIKLAADFHIVLSDDLETATYMGKSITAGYYEYSPNLFENLGFSWTGPSLDELKLELVKQNEKDKTEGINAPDFHHAADLVESGKLVNFIPEEYARKFCFIGNATQISDQIVNFLKDCYEIDVNFEYVVLHPVPDPPMPDIGPNSYMEKIPKEVLHQVKNRLKSV